MYTEYTVIVEQLALVAMTINIIHLSNCARPMWGLGEPAGSRAAASDNAPAPGNRLVSRSSQSIDETVKPSVREQKMRAD